MKQGKYRILHATKGKFLFYVVSTDGSHAYGWVVRDIQGQLKKSKIEDGEYLILAMDKILEIESVTKGRGEGCIL